MFKQTRAYLARYERRIIESERRARKQCEDWADVLRELHIDRGMLLGSEEWASLNGVERANALLSIDSKMGSAQEMTAAIMERVAAEHPPRAGFKHRCQRIRNRVSALSDDDLWEDD